MKLLIVCQHWPMCLGRRLLRPFERLGVDVRHIGIAKGADSGHGIVPERYIWQPQGDWDHYWSDWTPDVVLYAETLHTSWRHPYYLHVPHVQYNSAGPQDAPLPTMDYTLTAVSWGDIWDKTDRVTWIPCAYDEDMCSPSPIPWTDREYDVCLVGRLDNQRSVLLDALENAGFKVFRAEGLIYDEYAAAYHNSRMGLVTSPQGTVPIRVFEMPALGCLMLSPIYSEYCKLGVTYFEGFYEDVPEAMISTVKECLHWSESAESMLSLGFKWVQNHSWDNRVQMIMEVFKRL